MRCASHRFYCMISCGKHVSRKQLFKLVGWDATVASPEPVEGMDAFHASVLLREPADSGVIAYMCPFPENSAA